MGIFDEPVSKQILRMVWAFDAGDERRDGVRELSKKVGEIETERATALEQLDRANARIATLQSLRDTLAETIASGRLREIDIPDDYEALVRGIAATRESGE